MMQQTQVDDKKYPAIELAGYFVGLHRWYNFLDNPSDLFVYSMIFLSHGLSLRNYQRPLIKEDLIFDGSDILIPSLINIKENKTLEFVDFSRIVSLSPCDPYIRYYLVNIYQQYARATDRQLTTILCNSYMPRAECQRIGLKSGDKVSNKIIARCFN